MDFLTSIKLFFVCVSMTTPPPETEITGTFWHKAHNLATAQTNNLVCERLTLFKELQGLLPTTMASFTQGKWEGKTLQEQTAWPVVCAGLSQHFFFWAIHGPYTNEG